MTGITAIAIHLPRLRLQRASMAAAMDWLCPRSDTRGARTLAFWDEDPVTMGVAAARTCLAAAPQARAAVRALAFATTTPVFAEPQQASLMHAALRLPEQTLAQDTGGTLRCGLLALQQALEGANPALVIAADMPSNTPGSLAEFRYSDGAAAALVGGGPVLLDYRGGASLSAPFIERYRDPGHALATDWEERWVREAGVLELVPRAIAEALGRAGLSPADIHHVVLPCVIPGAAKAVAQAAGLGGARLAPPLDTECGDTGSAHALVMLARAMEDMRPGERVVVAQFGQGATALVLEATSAIADFAPLASVALSAGIAETNYLKLPVFRGLMPWERGLRGRLPVNEALTTAYRNSEALLGFVGGRSRETGQVQFPPSRLAVAETGLFAEPQEPWPLADLGGTVATATADRLAFSRSPPNCYGLVDIPGGARLMMDFTDPDAARLAPGDAARFVFRIKDKDERTGYRRYFWKAVAASALPATA
ncbi:3-oxoacyl-[acyl-carrier-protein] synthase III C-terminal domain-containing protein [Azorhizobium doebereinerae]|uniref:3-oxoacyl-[acyl-carrier-protein] synthase III C-terminal domain-containing protein n=1 Tax=Azorhizobium doebereinerae TaxID=281091 RepID=UPI00042321E4|nr:OB-fold domain-containing protein [Azorhizobium doebereinerae]